MPRNGGKRTFEHLLGIQHSAGGWRCNKVKMGYSPDTDASNPGVTLAALGGFRFTPYLNQNKQLDQAAKSQLDHWKTASRWGHASLALAPFLSYKRGPPCPRFPE